MHTYVPFSSKGDLFYIEFILMQMENAGYHLWVLVFIMVACGAFGGFLNYLNDFDTIENEKKNKQIRFKYILLGIGAAFLIPLFLNMISSDIIRSTDPADYLIFAGFCLVAAIFSRRFISTIGDRILEMAKNAEKMAMESKQKAETARKELYVTNERIEDVKQAMDLTALDAIPSVRIADGEEKVDGQAVESLITLADSYVEKSSVSDYGERIKIKSELKRRMGKLLSGITCRGKNCFVTIHLRGCCWRLPIPSSCGPVRRIWRSSIPQPQAPVSCTPSIPFFRPTMPWQEMG